MDCKGTAGTGGVSMGAEIEDGGRVWRCMLVWRIKDQGVPIASLSRGYQEI